MKTKILASLTNKAVLLILSIGFVAGLTSCSREMTSLTKSKDLQHVQFLKTNTDKNTSVSQITKTTNTASDQVADCSQNEKCDQVTTGTINYELKHKSVTNHKNLKDKLNQAKATAKIIQQKGLLVLDRQIFESRNLGKSHAVVSDNKSVERGGYLRKAIILGIVGIILEVIGFGLDIWLIWAIGDIFIIVAVIFLLLWLLYQI